MDNTGLSPLIADLSSPQHSSELPCYQHLEPTIDTTDYTILQMGYIVWNLPIEKGQNIMHMHINISMQLPFCFFGRVTPYHVVEVSYLAE